jgi:hypothetical protein
MKNPISKAARIITLYHCSLCNFEAGTQLMVIKHIKRKHEADKELEG